MNSTAPSEWQFPSPKPSGDVTLDSPRPAGTTDASPQAPAEFVREFFSRLRNGLAAAFVAWGVTPNALTVVGFLLTVIASTFLIKGAGHAAPWAAPRTATPTSWWPLAGAVVLTVALACDVLDGAVARIGRLKTPFGALLDSTLDRFSDLALCFGCATHFCLAHNVTYTVLSMAAAANAVLISYTKARAENLIDHCGVGFWQRPERSLLLLLAACIGHVPAALWVLGTLPLLTVIRRLHHAQRQLQGSTSDGDAPGHIDRPLGRVRSSPDHAPARGSVGYFSYALAVSVFVVGAPLLSATFRGEDDPLGSLLTHLGLA